MKIRKQFQKQAESGGGGAEVAALQEGDRKLSRQISLETDTSGRLLLGKSLFGDDESSPRRKTLAGASTTSQEEEDEPSAGDPQRGHNSSRQGGSTQLEVHADQALESLEESNSGSCGDWTVHQDDHNNARRKYARRSLRSTLPGSNGYSNGTAVAAKVIQRRSNPSRGEPRCPSEKAGHPSQTRFSSLGINWREQVKSYLTSNSYFKGVKARYFLSEQLQPPPKASKAVANERNLMDLNVEPRASRRFVSPDAKSRSVECDTPLSTSPDPSSVVNNEREGVQTRRKTYERTIEAVLNESAVEFQKTQKLEEIGDDRNTDELSTASRRSSDLHMTTTIVTPPESATIGGPSKKRKSPVLGAHGIDIPEPIDFRHTGAVPGSLKAMQARIVAETGVQNGARCSRKDGSNHHSKWQCPMMAMEGRSLCQHHNFLSERKKARYKKAKRQAAGKKSPPPRKEMNSQERGSSRKAPVMTQLQDLNKPPRESIEIEEHSNQIDEVAAPAHRIVRTRSDAHTNGSLAESANNAQTTEDMDSETEGGQLPLVKSRSVNPATIPEPGRQSFRSTRKPRMYLAAKKTAEKSPVVAPAPGKSVKKQSVPLIRPPSIPPLPMLYGVRRKSMKNRPSQSTL